MLYDFEDTETGETVELAMPMAEAVPIGETIERDGRTLRRVFSRVAGVHDRTFQPFESVQLAPGSIKTRRVGKDGQPIISSKRELHDLIARDRASARPQGLEWKR